MIPEGIRYYKEVTREGPEDLFGIQYENEKERLFLLCSVLAPYDHYYERTFIGMSECVVDVMGDMDGAGFIKTGTVEAQEAELKWPPS